MKNHKQEMNRHKKKLLQKMSTKQFFLFYKMVKKNLWSKKSINKLHCFFFSQDNAEGLH